jgi:hypothetical protein
LLDYRAEDGDWAKDGDWGEIFETIRRRRCCC